MEKIKNIEGEISELRYEEITKKRASLDAKEISGQASNKLQDKLGITTIFGGSDAQWSVAGEFYREGVDTAKKRIELEWERIGGIDIQYEVNSLIEKTGEVFEATALPAIKLHAFNLVLHDSGTEVQKIADIQKLGRRLSRLEKDFQDPKNPLPTIGVEIEIPRRVLSSDKVKALNQLNIPNRSEISMLWEVNPSFSYDPWVQGRILQELVNMGAIPLELSEEKITQKIPKRELLSLHLNFGMPGQLDDRILYEHKEDIQIISDAITYAYSSSQRILGRKTSHSAYYNKESDKSLKSDFDANRPVTLRRIEFRATEFRDYPTYRLLAESQRLVGMLIAFIKTQNKLPVTEVEVELAELWPEFVEGFKSHKYGLRQNATDKSKWQVAQSIKWTDLKAKQRHLVADFSRRIVEIIKSQSLNKPVAS